MEETRIFRIKIESLFPEARQEILYSSILPSISHNADTGRYLLHYLDNETSLGVYLKPLNSCDVVVWEEVTEI